MVHTPPCPKQEMRRTKNDDKLTDSKGKQRRCRPSTKWVEKRTRKNSNALVCLFRSKYCLVYAVRSHFAANELTIKSLRHVEVENYIFFLTFNGTKSALMKSICIFCANIDEHFHRWTRTLGIER